MNAIPVSDARARLYRLIDQVAVNHKEVVITGKRHNAVLLSEEDWATIQETLYLLSMPGMGKSIRDGLETPLDECDEDLDW